MRTLTQAQQAVFKLYKGNGPFQNQQCFADFLNTTLGCGQQLPPQWEAHAIELDGLIQASLLPSSTKLYRAMLDCYLAPHLEADTLRYPAYMSTSIEELAVRRHFASTFRGLPAALLRIECDVGTPALDMEGSGTFGGTEQELLLPRGSTFKIENVEVIEDKNEMTRLMTQMYAENYSSLKIYQLKYSASE